jgi:ABC-2 type transport system permease protein
MIRLTRVELRRLFSRRLTVLGLLGTLVITGLMLYAVFDEAKPLSEADMRTARSSFETAQRDWQANGEKMVAQCKADEAKQRETDPNADYRCDHMEPKWEHWGKPEVRFAENLPNYLVPMSYLLAAAAFLIGAGFVGAEFSSGSIGNWLTFEPRRVRVYASKLASAASGIVPAAVALTAILVAGAWVIVDRYGSTAGMNGDRWADFAGMSGRIVVLTSVAAVVGAVCAMFLRHTAAALGVVAAYMVLIEGIFSGLLNDQRKWFLVVNVDSWVRHGTTYGAESCRTQSDGTYFCDWVEKHLSFSHSATYLGILFAILVVAAALVFRRRDIT